MNLFGSLRLDMLLGCGAFGPKHDDGRDIGLRLGTCWERLPSLRYPTMPFVHGPKAIWYDNLFQRIQKASSWIHWRIKRRPLTHKPLTFAEASWSFSWDRWSDVATTLCVGHGDSARVTAEKMGAHWHSEVSSVNTNFCPRTRVTRDFYRPIFVHKMCESSVVVCSC